MAEELSEPRPVEEIEWQMADLDAQRGANNRAIDKEYRGLDTDAQRIWDDTTDQLGAIRADLLGDNDEIKEAAAGILVVAINDNPEITNLAELYGADLIFTEKREQLEDELEVAAEPEVRRIATELLDALSQSDKPTNPHVQKAIQDAEGMLQLLEDDSFRLSATMAGHLQSLRVVQKDLRKKGLLPASVNP